MQTEIIGEHVAEELASDVTKWMLRGRVSGAEAQALSSFVDHRMNGTGSHYFIIHLGEGVRLSPDAMAFWGNHVSDWDYSRLKTIVYGGGRAIIATARVIVGVISVATLHSRRPSVQFVETEKEALDCIEKLRSDAGAKSG